MHVLWCCATFLSSCASVRLLCQIARPLSSHHLAEIGNIRQKLKVLQELEARDHEQIQENAHLRGRVTSLEEQILKIVEAFKSHKPVVCTCHTHMSFMNPCFAGEVICMPACPFVQQQAAWDPLDKRKTTETCFTTW